MMMGKIWGRRPPDVANLFNPAFCATLLNRVASGYHGDIERGLAYPLSFVALPLILHPTSADLLPPTSRTKFHNWLLENPEVLFGFSERAREMAPIVREAISFGLRYDILRLDAEKALIPMTSRELKQWEKMPYNKNFSKNAQILGKLLTQVKDVPTTFALFGVRP
ncbi:three component ABC system middle component [Azospira restricta]|uniref:Uncharacterized protein n=1 Tax=Azospira restricta TaxID=404405 RepID=A0A974PYH4_9RHOO|nr:three component ABC system middle component [Azospira restricta]QRJ63320.1 hypothetical protein IWH25_16475 [Azospira restricta]